METAQFIKKKKEKFRLQLRKKKINEFFDQHRQKVKLTYDDQYKFISRDGFDDVIQKYKHAYTS